MNRTAEIAARLGLRRLSVPVIRQSEAAECGLVCLGMIASYHGHRVDLGTLRRRFPPSLRGAGLARVAETAASLHLAGRALRLELSELSRLRTPCILHWNLSHFVVLVSARGERVVVHDPATGRRVYTLAEASRHFTGVALELSPTPGFYPQREERRLRIRELWTRVRGLASSIAVIFTLSLILQGLMLAGPFYVQLVVDDVLARSDQGLLRVLALGFALLLGLRAVVSLTRELSLLYTAHLMNFQMASNLMSHLIRVPLSYFEKRHVGDVLSRFGSLAPIEELLTSGFIGAALDGMMSILTLSMMLVYSPLLSAVTLGAAVLYGALRVAMYAPQRRLSEEEILAQASEQSVLIETLHGMQPIKLLGSESRRESLWQNRRADSLNAGIRSGRWNIAFSTARTLLMGAESLAVVYLAAHMVLESRFSVGMLFAFMSYKDQFTSRVSALIEWAIRCRMLEVHLSRLSDIVHTEEERGLRTAPAVVGPLQGEIELRDVSFRYSDSDPFILRGVSLRIEPGTCLALTGPSGSGKTTLLKILLGLLEPSEGEILIDGRPLGDFGLSHYRQQVGAVMQDDQLFEGTLAENICAFDPDEERERVEAAARSAQIHEEICAMPMGYHSLVSNMGSSLSGGQRQRILLARAFYRSPRVLVLDEGTANLDPGTLEKVRSTLSEIPCTRILATHQAEVISGCDRVFAVR